MIVKDSINSTIIEMTEINSIDIIRFRNDLLYKFATYKEGRTHWSIDTTNLGLDLCNPRDTMEVNVAINKFNLLATNNNIDLSIKKLTLLQINQTIFDRWKYRYDYVTLCGFNRAIPFVRYEKNILLQNEISYIYPNLFITGYDEPIHILKENSTEFIMENGEKKNFTNPITLKASSKKGVHTVKGEIMIKQKGELIPKPFEFRYIVE